MNAITTCPFHSASKEFKPYYTPELHAAFEVQRRGDPVFWSEEIGYWVLTKHSDIHSVLHDGERFSSQNTTRPVNPMNPDPGGILPGGGFLNQPGSPSRLNGAVHKRIRSVTSQTLNLREFVKLDGHIREL